MNVGELIKKELQTLLADAENTQLGETLKAYIDGEIKRIEDEVKAYVDEAIAKAFQPSTTVPPAQSQG